MLAPHSLALHGNLAGEWGLLFPLGLMATAGIYLLLIGSRRKLDPDKPPLAGEAAVYQRMWGDLPALVFPLAGRLLTALAGATGLLVTAGFAFNETFLYWFPNFAFAFLLLGVVAVIQLGGPRVVQAFQLIFIAIAVGGLTVLALIALAGSGTYSPRGGGAGSDLSIQSWAPLLLLFVGVDLVLLNRSTQRAAAHRAMAGGILAATLLFTLWGWAAVRHLPLQRLSDTTIAPILVAKQVWGQNGRYTMGVVTISGTLAAVNALFTMVAATIESWGRVVGHESSKRLPVLVTVLLGTVTAVLMASGMAGTEAIDVALRAGLVLWLLHYALVPLLQRMKGPLTLLTGGAVLGGAAVLSLTDPERGLLLIFMLTALAAAALVAVGLWWRHRWVNHRERSSQ